jgi:hypothetical protein
VDAPPCEAAGATAFVDPATGQCYLFFSSSQRTRSGARNQCEALGAHLVTLSSTVENGLIFPSLGGLDHWIGLTESAGTWSWDTGEPVPYTNWGAGEPGTSGGACAIIDGTSAVWRDRGCGQTERYVCERP